MPAAVLRHSPRDALLVTAAAGYGVLLIVAPSAPLIAVGVWWIANTVAHNFIHLPFFTSRAANSAFSAYLSLLLGVPQTLWRDRHLAHHAGRPWRVRWSAQFAVECMLVAVLWLGLAFAAPTPIARAWIIGWAVAMLLCLLQGHYEHVRGTVSHYGSLYNLAFFNDGFHAEHHARPGLHWSALGSARRRATATSRWPAVLRWLEIRPLDGLERLVLHSGALQRFVVARHERAFRRLLAAFPAPRRVTIVGGGLFPRTAMVLQRVLPEAALTVVDRSGEHLRQALPYLDTAVRTLEADYTPAICNGADLVIVPLAFDGDRHAFYTHPPAPAVLVHDWIWRRRGEGRVISFLLLKRLNLVRR